MEASGNRSRRRPQMMADFGSGPVKSTVAALVIQLFHNFAVAVDELHRFH